MKAHAVVIGGGVMGCSIAWHLACRLDPLSQPVVLLEKTSLAAGSSGRSGAILRQHYASSELAGMARDSLRAYAGLARTTGRSIGFRRTGVLLLARTPEDVARVRANVELMRGLGIDTRVVDADEVRRLVPGIQVDDDTVGAWEPEGGTVDPAQTVEAFAALAKTRGATVREGLGAEGLAVEDGRVVGVETAEGTIETGTAIVATGPWTGRFLARLGVDLPLRVVRPEQHFIEMPSAPAGAAALSSAAQGGAEELEGELDERLGPLEPELAPAAHPVLLDVANGLYARCDPDRGRTRIGDMDTGTDAEVSDPDALDEEVSERFRAWAHDTLGARLPTYADRADLDSLAGLYTLTPDDQAVIGAAPPPAPEGLVVVAGFSGHGFKLAPSIGEGVAQLVLGEPVSAFDPAFFAPGRFRDRPVEAGRGFGL